MRLAQRAAQGHQARLHRVQPMPQGLHADRACGCAGAGVGREARVGGLRRVDLLRRRRAQQVPLLHVAQQLGADHRALAVGHKNHPLKTLLAQVVQQRHITLDNEDPTDAVAGELTEVVVHVRHRVERRAQALQFFDGHLAQGQQARGGAGNGGMSVGRGGYSG